VQGASRNFGAVNGALNPEETTAVVAHRKKAAAHGVRRYGG